MYKHQNLFYKVFYRFLIEFYCLIQTSSMISVIMSCPLHIYRYVCDPVLGDNGKYYVPQTLVDIFRNVVIPK